jgi:hypothetical protein
MLNVIFGSFLFFVGALFAISTLLQFQSTDLLARLIVLIACGFIVAGLLIITGGKN